MSREGLEIAAKVFSDMQESRGLLLRIATEKKPIDQQDLRLAQMLEEMEEAGKEKFTRLTLVGG